MGKMKYDIIYRDGCKYVTNMNGDILYEATGISDAAIDEMVEIKSYIDWRKYRLAMDPPNTRGMQPERKFNTSRWFEDGDNIIEVMEKHPKRSYSECLLMLKLEGMHLDGMIVRSN